MLKHPNTPTKTILSESQEEIFTPPTILNNEKQKTTTTIPFLILGEKLFQIQRMYWRKHTQFILMYLLKTFKNL